MSTRLTDDEVQQLWRRINLDVEAGNWVQASSGAEQALAEGADHPLLYKLRATKRDRDGDFLGAAEDYRTVLATEPENNIASAAMALSLSKAGRFKDAVAILDRLIAANPGFHPALFNRGWTYENAGELRKAEQDYRETLIVKPDHVDAMACLASVQFRLGQVSEAKTTAEGVVVSSPANAPAQTVLARIEIKQGEFGQATDRLHTLLSQGDGLNPHERSVAEGCLGDVLDKAGRFSEAFAAYTKANGLLKSVYSASFAPQGRIEPGMAKAERVVAYLERIDAEIWRGFQNDARTRAAGEPKGHVFLVGFPRSGTTLMGQVLAAHPDVVTIDERETLSEIGGQFLSSVEGLSRLTQLDLETITRFRADYWRLIGVGAEIGGKIFVDKLPLNTVGLPLVKVLFPDAKILFMRRDPRDVVLSAFRHSFVVNAGTWELLTLDGAAKFYDAVMRIGLLSEEKLQLATRNQSLERLITDFAEETRGLCAFIGIPWHERMADFADRSAVDVIATPSAQQIKQGLNDAGVGKWRAYEKELQPVLASLDYWIDAFH